MKTILTSWISLLQMMVAVLLVTPLAFSQKDGLKYLRENDKTVKDLAEKLTSDGLILFKKDSKVNRTDFFKQFGKALGMNGEYDMQKVRDILDRSGVRNEIYQLYFKKIKVEGVFFSVHSKKEQVLYSMGKMVENLGVETTKFIKEQDSFNAALKELNQDIAKYKNKPMGELVIVMVNDDDYSNTNFKLAYRYEMGSAESDKTDFVEAYIDANEGKLLRKNSLSRNCFNASEHYDSPIQTQLKQPDEIKNIVADNTTSTFIPLFSRYLPYSWIPTADFVTLETSGNQILAKNLVDYQGVTIPKGIWTKIIDVNEYAQAKLNCSAYNFESNFNAAAEVSNASTAYSESSFEEVGNICKHHLKESRKSLHKKEKAFSWLRSTNARLPNILSG